MQRRHQERIQFQTKNINILGIKKYQILPSHLPKFCPGYKSLRDEADDDRHDSTDTSHTDKENSIDNLKSMNENNIDDEYK